MNATNLFVEIVVIGLGAAMVVAMAVLALFGYEWVPVDALQGTGALLLVTGTVYVLGIVADRLADLAFASAAKKKRHDSFGTTAAYQEARSIVYAKSPMRAQLEYGRSRLRIVRGWTLTAAISAPLSVVLVCRQAEDAERAAIGATVFVGFIALAVGCAAAWSRLYDAQIDGISTQADLIKAGKLGG